MDLSPYVESFHSDLTAAAAAGTEQTQQIAGQLASALDAALRLCLLDALSAMAAEVTATGDLGVVDIRMHGREPQVVVSAAGQVEQPPAAASGPPASDLGDPGETDDGGLARITLRLPEALKVRAERAAATDGQSMNAWLVRAVAAAVSPDGFSGGFSGGSASGGTGAGVTTSGRIGRRMTGYARG